MTFLLATVFFIHSLVNIECNWEVMREREGYKSSYALERASITHLEKRGPFRLGKELPLFFEKSHSFTLRGSYSLILMLEGGCRVPVETVLLRLLMPHPTLNRNSVLHLLVPLPLLRIRVTWSRVKRMVGN